MRNSDFVEVNGRLQVLHRKIVREFPNLDLEIIQEMVEAGENMVALEMLVGALAESRLSISKTSHWEIAKLAKIMNLDSPRFLCNIAILESKKMG